MSVCLVKYLDKQIYIGHVLYISVKMTRYKNIKLTHIYIKCFLRDTCPIDQTRTRADNCMSDKINVI